MRILRQKKKYFFFVFVFCAGFFTFETFAVAIPRVDGFQTTAKDSSSITLAWNAVANADFYQLRRVKKNGETIKKWKVESTTKNLNALSSDKKYRFKVRAVAGVIKGAWSKTIIVRTESMPENNDQFVGETVDVAIQDFIFNPDTITISAGDTVRWTDHDSINHTVTSDDGLFESSGSLNNTTYEVTFTKSGTYAYHCAPHPFMIGTIIVQ